MPTFINEKIFVKNYNPNAGKDGAQRGRDASARARQATRTSDEMSESLPSFSDIKHELPEGAIASNRSVAVGEDSTIVEKGRVYVLLTPVKKTKQGYVYVPER